MANFASDRSISFMPMTPPPNLKREASAEDEERPSKKRQSSTLTFDNGSNIVRVRASGQKVRPEVMYTEDDELVRGLQQQDVKIASGSKVDGVSGEVKDADAESRYEDADAEAVSDAEMQDMGGGDPGEADEDDEEDLFAKSFGKEEALPDDDDAVDTDGEILEIKGKGKQRVTDYNDHDPTEHSAGCDTLRAASTPPRSQGRKIPAVPQGPKEADLIKDVRRSLNYHRKLQDKAKQFRPRIPLAEHRYWICVLHPSRRIGAISSEKHFTWMKGNRVSTIETIWHTYQTTNMTDAFVLLLGQERVDFKDKCEELDYFHDKFICLRAVGESEKEAQGKELSDECPPEVIELDED